MWLAVALGCLWVADAAPAAPSHEIGALRLIGVRAIPPKTQFQGTAFGGLSGIDYEPASNTWIAESDDRSELSPARFYTLRIDYDEKNFTAAEATAVTFFRQADGTTYPNKAQVAARGGDVPDLEAVRFDPRDGSVWYASEGDRPLGLNPFVRHAARDGRLLAELPTPAMFALHQNEEAGPRHNLSFEGLAFAPDGKTLWVAMEAPRYEDGPVATPTTEAMTRFTHFHRDAYPIEPIPVAPAAGKLADNGVSEILAVNDHTFLVLERSGAQDAAGVFHYSARVFEVELRDATDVRELPALRDANFRPVRKRLVVDFNQLGRAPVDNLEGMTWGQPLANGHSTLVFVSDDNFSTHQETQFWAFEVLPKVRSSTSVTP